MMVSLLILSFSQFLSARMGSDLGRIRDEVPPFFPILYPSLDRDCHLAPIGASHAPFRSQCSHVSMFFSYCAPYGSLILVCLTVSHHKPLPNPDRPPGSDLSSIGPSQSASQIFLPALSSATLTDQPASCVIQCFVTFLTNTSCRTPPRVPSPSPLPPRSSSPFPVMPLSSSVILQIPPAHSISEFALPSTRERRISEEYGEANGSSSEEDSRPVEVVENVRFKSNVGASASTSNVGSVRRFSLRGPRPRDNSGSNTTSSGTGTGTGSLITERIKSPSALFL